MLNNTHIKLKEYLRQSIVGLIFIEKHPEIITNNLRSILINQNKKYLTMLRPTHSEILYSKSHTDHVTPQDRWDVMKKLVEMEKHYNLIELISKTLRAYIYISSSLHGYINCYLIPTSKIHGDATSYGRQLGQQKYGLLLKANKLSKFYRFDYLKNTKQ